MKNKLFSISSLVSNIPLSILLSYPFFFMLIPLYQINSKYVVIFFKILILLYFYNHIINFLYYFISILFFKVKIKQIKINPLSISDIISIITFIITFLLSLLAMLKYIYEEFNVYYYDRLIKNFNEISLITSSINKNIAFEVVKIENINFYGFEYILDYMFKMFNISELIFTIFIASFIMQLYKNTKKDFGVVLSTNRILNFLSFIFIFSILYTIDKYDDPLKDTLINELKQSNYNIYVKYPFLEGILQNKIFKVKIFDKDEQIDKKYYGLVSYYPLEGLNIIHENSIFCSLKNYEFSNLERTPKQLTNINKTFKPFNSNITIDIKQKDIQKNIHDIYINDGNKIKNIKDTILEYSGEKIFFKKIGNDGVINDTSVSIRCKNYIQSIYYGNIEVSTEDIESYKRYSPQQNNNIYLYRGENINNFNPYKCSQINKLNDIVEEKLLKLYEKDFKKFYCIENNNIKKMKNELDRINYNNKY